MPRFGSNSLVGTALAPFSLTDMIIRSRYPCAHSKCAWDQQQAQHTYLTQQIKKHEEKCYQWCYIFASIFDTLFGWLYCQGSTSILLATESRIFQARVGYRVWLFVFLGSILYTVRANPILQKTVRNLTSPEISFCCFFFFFSSFHKLFCTSWGLDIARVLLHLKTQEWLGGGAPFSHSLSNKPKHLYDTFANSIIFYTKCHYVSKYYHFLFSQTVTVCTMLFWKSSLPNSEYTPSLAEQFLTT